MILGAFVKLREVTICFVMFVFLSVCPFAWNKSLTLEGFFKLNLLFEYFSKILPEKLRYFKTQPEISVLHIKSYVHL